MNHTDAVQESGKDHIADRGYNSMTHCKLLHKPILIPQAMKMLDAKAAFDKEWEKVENCQHGENPNLNRKNEVIERTQNEGKTVQFATLMGLCRLKNSKLERKFQKYQGREVLRGRRGKG